MPKRDIKVANQYAVRLDDRAAAAVEALRARLNKERPGLKATASDAIRILVDEGAKHLK
jgi:hypothetical protein